MSSPGKKSEKVKIKGKRCCRVAAFLVGSWNICFQQWGYSLPKFVQFLEKGEKGGIFSFSIRLRRICGHMKRWRAILILKVGLLEQTISNKEWRVRFSYGSIPISHHMRNEPTHVWKFWSRPFVLCNSIESLTM